MMEKVEFTILPDGKILDLRPMYLNNPPLVYKEGAWVIFEGTQKEIIESQPISSEKISHLTSLIN